MESKGKQMLLIEDVKVREVCGNHCAVPRLNPMSVDFTQEPSFEIEHVRGKKFMNSNGDIICIGMAKHVQESVGLPFEAFDNMNKELSNLRDNFASHTRKIKDLSETLAVSAAKLESARSASIWQRVRYVFTRRLP